MYKDIVEEKITYIVQQKYPEFTNKIEEFIAKTSSDYDADPLDGTVVYKLYSKYWENYLKPLNSLSVEPTPKLEEDPVSLDFTPPVVKARLVAWLDEIYTLFDELNSLDASELQKRFTEAQKGNPKPPFLTEEERNEKRKKRIVRQKEPLYYFNDEPAKADFKYWLELSSWTSDEAIFLSLGKDPRVVNETTLSKTLQGEYKFTKFSQEVGRRTELLKRAVEDKLISEPFSPADFFKWCQSHSLDMPEELAACKPTKKRRSAEVGVDPKRLKSIYKILLGLSCQHHGHVLPSTIPGAKKNSPAPQQICHLLSDFSESSEADYGVGVDTIRHVLNEAHKYLSEE